MAKTRLGKMPYVIVFCLVIVLVLLASGLGFVTDMPLKGIDPDDVTSISLSDAMGVNDPVKVTRTALQSASSVAALILITEATINEIPKDPDPAAAAAAAAAAGAGGMY